jgi:RNase H-fold protein (predicted Holliday junction resolvase)
VDHVIREGQILPQLSLLIQEMQPDVFVVGKPKAGASISSPLSWPDIEAFLTDLEANQSIQVVAVEIQLLT